MTAVETSQREVGGMVGLGMMESLWAIEPNTFRRMLGVTRVQRDAKIPLLEARRSPPEYEVAEGVAVIEILGVSTKYADWFTLLFGGSVYTEVEELVKRAVADNEVRAILLKIDSPGGTVAGVSDVADAVLAARQVKATVAYISDLAGSAAYYVAAQANAIYADADAVIGSIGTLAIVDDWSRFFENAGVQVHVVSTGPYKGAFVRGARVKDEHLEDEQRVVDNLGEIFVEAIARGRRWPVERARAVADGRVWVAQQEAKSMGLIDGIAGFDDVLAAMQAVRPGEDIEKAITGTIQRDMKERGMFGKKTGADAESAGQIDEAAVKAATEEAVKAERDRVKAIGSALGADWAAEARQEAIAEGLDVMEAKALGLAAAEAEIAVLRAEATTKDEQLAEARQKLEAVAAGGVEPIDQAASDDQAEAEAAAKAAEAAADPAGRFEARVEELVAGGMKKAAALSQASAEDAEGHTAWIEKANEKKG